MWCFSWNVTNTSGYHCCLSLLVSNYILWTHSLIFYHIHCYFAHSYTLTKGDELVYMFMKLIPSKINIYQIKNIRVSFITQDFSKCCSFFGAEKVKTGRWSDREDNNILLSHFCLLKAECSWSLALPGLSFLPAFHHAH